MEKSSFKLKLLIDTQSEKVLFAEANKDVVDFLFYILSLPVATVVNLVREQGSVGSLGNLHESLECLDITYIQPNQSKNTILVPGFATSVPLLLSPADQTSGVKKFYRCRNRDHCGNNYITDDQQALCPTCMMTMTRTVTYVAPPQAQPLNGASSAGVGIVKEVVTYMVLDDLMVKPMSSISSITLLNKLKVKDLGVLEEKVVNLGMEEAVKMLSIMMKSTSVLTEVFVKDGKLDASK